LVGDYGSGKTTLAVALAALYARHQGAVCALRMECGLVRRFDAAAGDFADDAHEPGLLDSADFLFIEARPQQRWQVALREGDRVIRLGVARGAVEQNIWPELADSQPNPPSALMNQGQGAIGSEQQGAAHG